VLTLRAPESGDVSEPAPTSASSASSAVEPWARSTCGCLAPALAPIRC